MLGSDRRCGRTRWDDVQGWSDRVKAKPGIRPVGANLAAGYGR